MSDKCTQGELNKHQIEELTKAFAERNTENMLLRKSVNQLESDNAVMKNDIAHIKYGVREIKDMIRDDQVGRNEKREQVETNRLEIKSLKQTEGRQNKWNMTCVFVIIAAAIKVAFF